MLEAVAKTIEIFSSGESHDFLPMSSNPKTCRTHAQADAASVGEASKFTLETARAHGDPRLDGCMPQ